MKYIYSKNLKEWKARESQEMLPELVKKLIRATSSNKIISLTIPSGDDVALAGYDGILHVSEATEFYPEGVSVWEIGTEQKSIRKKADGDYQKRKNNPMVSNPSECTFIFVTNKIFQDANEWVEEKKKENFWKDVIVINASKLEDWLEITPMVSLWLAAILKIIPPLGIDMPENYWRNWSTNPQTGFSFHESVLLGGRDLEVDKFFQLLKTKSIITVEAQTIGEAIAFIVCSFLSNPKEVDDFLSRSLIIENIDSLRQISMFSLPLILIPKFEDEQAVNFAIEKGHKVIIPLAPDSTIKWTTNKEKIFLPRVQRDPLINSLIKSGLEKEEAKKHSRESSRNLNVLRRHLHIPSATPEWAKPDNIRDLIPAILVGKWNEITESDKKIIEDIAGITYEEYTYKLLKLKHCADSPLINIGGSWRLSSPLDAWELAAKYITQSDYEKLKSACIQTLKEIHPMFELPPEQRFMAPVYKKVSKFSSFIKEGLLQSLSGNFRLIDPHVSF